MVTNKIIDSYKEWFDEYIYKIITKYPELSENITIKANHCKLVSNEARGVAIALGLKDDKLLFAETLGLFHDIGRFRQYVKYQTFSDSKSQNHSELGVEVLKEYNILNELSEYSQNVIFKSIINHSRAEIIPDKDNNVMLFSKLIRDADKLDIWRLITEYYMVKEQKQNKTIELELPNTNEISDEVFESIINKKVVLKESMKTLNDFKLMQIGWLFDLNFNYSIERLYQNKYLDKIFDSLIENERIKQLRDVVNDYFKLHLETLTI